MVRVWSIATLMQKISAAYHPPHLFQLHAERVILRHHADPVEAVRRLGEDAMMDADRLGIGDAGQYVLHTAAEPGPEVGLHNAEEHDQVGVFQVAVEVHRRVPARGAEVMVLLQVKGVMVLPSHQLHVLRPELRRHLVLFHGRVDAEAGITRTFFSSAPAFFRESRIRWKKRSTGVGRVLSSTMITIFFPLSLRPARGFAPTGFARELRPGRVRRFFSAASRHSLGEDNIPCIGNINGQGSGAPGKLYFHAAPRVMD